MIRVKDLQVGDLLLFAPYGDAQCVLDKDEGQGTFDIGYVKTVHEAASRVYIHWPSKDGNHGLLAPAGEGLSTRFRVYRKECLLLEDFYLHLSIHETSKDKI